MQLVLTHPHAPGPRAAAVQGTVIKSVLNTTIAWLAQTMMLVLQ